MKPSVLFLLPYPLHKAPSQRFRVEAFFKKLKEAGIVFNTDTFLDEGAWKVLYQNGSNLQKGWAVLKGFIKRLNTVCFKAYQYDYIFIHREASPIGPPIFEWLLANILRKKVIFDFDDAIWIPNLTESNKLARSVKCFWKVANICKWSHKISVGNAYLAAYANNHNQRVTIVPTCVDTETRFNQLQDQEVVKPVIGWTGSHSTLKYLDALVPVLQKLEQRFDFTFLVICNQQPNFHLKGLQFLPWCEDTEIDDLLKIHIGVMPLKADAWSEGKCGFKIIQYLSLGIPAVASPVGVNKEIVNEGVNGYLCAAEKDWYNALTLLIKDAALRNQLGEVGRNKIVRQYSIAANSHKFISLFS